MKKIIICVFLILGVYLLWSNDNRNMLFLNWKIYVPKPNKIDSIYRFEYREGNDLEIWYYKDDKFKKIISRNDFNKITLKNINTVNKLIENYYDRLNEVEKSKFNKRLDKKKILLKNNYYFYKEENRDSFLIIIADSENNMLYLFTSI